jgi:UDP-N-acetyl-D-mannosaminuronic acid transferase (WecB/TagA/CpsF family)
LNDEVRQIENQRVRRIIEYDPDATRPVVERAVRGEGAWFLALNTEMLARGALEPDYWKLVGTADIITAVGMPLVCGLRN